MMEEFINIANELLKRGLDNRLNAMRKLVDKHIVYDPKLMTIDDLKQETVMNDFKGLKGKPILCLDFDGVIHSYSSGWKGAEVIPDPPVPEAINWIKCMLGEEFIICIFSSRSRYPEGIDAMRVWLVENGLSLGELGQIDFPTEKPPAFLTIDDRAITFNGTFPKLSQIRNFKPWNK